MADRASLRSAAAAAASSPVTPAAWAALAPRSMATAMGVGSRRPKLDSAIAFWNRPRASGASISSRIEMPPALSPPMVMLFGSPPKLAMLAFTHLSAAIWSM